MLRIIRSKLFLLLFITVVLLTVMGVSANKYDIKWIDDSFNVVISPLQKGLSFVSLKVQHTFEFFADVKTLRQDNENLLAQLNDLENENRELRYFRDENKELRLALNIKSQFEDYNSIGANIIAKDAGNWFNVFTIDRGKRDSVFDDYPIITNKGLVGRIMNAGMFSSKVISIIDIDSTVSARVTKSRDLVLVKGDIYLKDKGLCRMDILDASIDVSVGDTIETSGLGGIYPKGILIGRISEVRKVNNDLSRYAIIEPAIDFKRLEQVFILQRKAQSSGVINASEMDSDQ